jgi:membrane-associated protease RseP (regulator of RpoE activity)
MVSFMFYDLIFFLLFTLATIVFLYKRKHNLKRQGLMYLYRTRIGLKIIDWTSEKFEKILRPMQFLIVGCGYILMGSMIWLLAKFTYIYSVSDIAKQIKIPPILPLFPYATDLFKLDFLPPFYFTYWIIIIAVIAISHEFAHGIFARLNKIKVHSTGFGFLGPFLAAFVEPDEKEMQKAKKFTQLSILAAGTFANILMTILFGGIMALFFVVSFAPAGINFNSYAESVVPLAAITVVEGMQINNFNEINSYLENNMTEIGVEGINYIVPTVSLKYALENNIERIIVFDDAPAFRANLKSPILEIDGEKIVSHSELSNFLDNALPGDIVNIKTGENGEINEYEIELSERNGKSFIGIGFKSPSNKGVSGYLTKQLYKIKDPFVHYVPSWNGNFAWFIYNLLWWIVLINLSVALVNMLPVGIFDGGRFFYLTIWGLTGSEKLGRKAFALATWLIIFILIWLMIVWTFAVI